MVFNLNTLSSFESRSLGSNIAGLTFKQFKRTYPGNFDINFALCLSASNDIKTKNYSNFYLTNNYKFTDIFGYDSSKFKATEIYTPLLFGSEYLTFTDINPTLYNVTGGFQSYKNYGIPTFQSSQPTNFNIAILADNKCNIYFTKNYKKFYLCVTSDNSLFFIRESLLTFDKDSNNSQDFTYLYSETDNFMLFFKQTSMGDLFLTKSGNYLVTVPTYGSDITSYLSSPFQIFKNIFSEPNISLNTTFITYNSDNTINFEKSDLELTNNFLIHNKYSDIAGNSDIIVLKNQLLQNDVFSSSNNLLSSQQFNCLVNDLREYTTISDDIKEEETEDLTLSYVFYNKPYVIKSGSNTFVSPSSLYPFSVLNINDTKFIESGAYSHTSPEFSDRIYHVSNNPVEKNNGQYLLCTWLSGSPFSDQKVWVDRYFYPDLVEKAEALAGRAITNVTYTEYIEQLIQQNSSLYQETATRKFFDKLSDMAFIPNETYIYERLNNTQVPQISSLPISYCSNIMSPQPSNYFKQINSKGELTLAFNFKGDDRSWTLRSDRNKIDSGITITKDSGNINIICKMFDSTNFSEDNLFFTKSASVNFKPLKDNFVCISINVKTGEGYFFVNDTIIENFTIPIYEYLIKQILYGDFFLETSTTKTNAFLISDQISNIQVSSDYTSPDIAFSLAVSNFNLNIDDLIITLPCGMRNSSDNIDLLQSICGSSMSKSNNVNVLIKNLNISSDSVLTGLKDSISTNIANYLPANTNIKNIQFINFK